MTASGAYNPDRLSELLAGKALCDLALEEEREFDTLAARAAADLSTEPFELTAAALDLFYIAEEEAIAHSSDEPLPESLAAAIQTSADSVMRTRAVDARTEPAPQPAPTRSEPAIAGRIGPDRNSSAGLAWLAAAAAIALAAIAWWPASAPDLNTKLGNLLTSDAQRVQWKWQGLGELESSAIGGEAIWSQERDEGYMRFSGLPVNDPSVEQYQLWIFDPSQSDATPIDGGVFDIDADGNAIVEIDPKLSPTGPTMFAITIEQPGGVVVSSRERLVLIATPPAPDESEAAQG